MHYGQFSFGTCFIKSLEIYNFKTVSGINFLLITLDHGSPEMTHKKFGVIWPNGLGGVRKSRFLRKSKMAENLGTRKWAGPIWIDAY